MITEAIKNLQPINISIDICEIPLLTTTNVLPQIAVAKISNQKAVLSPLSANFTSGN